MIFDDVIGHEPAKSILRRALREERVPHALLLVGPDGVGKAALARAFAAAALCEHGDDGCGTCRGCVRVAHGNHPDFLVVTREPKKPGAASDTDELRSEIVVAQIRDLAVHAGYPPREARRRVLLVDPADRMNHEAQNALLKTLEEPPSHTVVVLTASGAHRLLPTVRSRCFSLVLTAIESTRLARALEATGTTPDEAASRAALSGGLPRRAVELDVDDLRARRAALLGDLEALAASPGALSELVARSERLVGADENDFRANLELVQSLLRDAARLAIAGAREGLRHGDLAEPLTRLGSRIGARRAAELVASIDEIRRRLRFHANRTYLAETLVAALAGGPLPTDRFPG